jgi:ATP-dependent RNA helicase RhlE
MSFRELGLDARVLRAVQEAGYVEPTPIQAAAIPPALSGRDVIGVAQTGTGKTAAYTLPMLTRLAADLDADPQPGTRALVLAPTRELAVQIEENVRGYAKHLRVSLATVFGGVGERPQIEALRKGAQLVIACPGRLLDLMSRRYADFSRVSFLALDEADRMLDMGFLPSINRIVRALPHERQTLLFSATMSREIETLTREFQKDAKLVQIGRRANPAESVAQFVYEVSQGDKPGLLRHLLADPGMNMVLVFSRMKHAADRVARELERDGIRAATLHANRSQSQRLRALKAFKSGEVRVLVATDIASRGIDVDGISHVVNYDFPAHPEDYVHRIGRTGRAHAVGDAISFVTPEDRGALRALERFIGRGIVRKHAENFVPLKPSPRAEREAEHGERAHQPERPRPQGERRGFERGGPREDRGGRREGGRSEGFRARPDHGRGERAQGPRDARAGEGRREGGGGFRGRPAFGGGERAGDSRGPRDARAGESGGGRFRARPGGGNWDRGPRSGDARGPRGAGGGRSGPPRGPGGRDSGRFRRG